MMATAVSKPPSQPPKMKRPLPSFAQTGVNGIKQSPSATSSPAMTAKRLPGTSQPSSVNSAGAAAANGVNNRPTNRPRKDIQKTGEVSSRQQRPLTRNATVETDRRVTKIPPEPYVKTTSYILKKYSKSPPSLILHLHPTHFRFDQQEGSFPYNSEMKVIIEHLRAGTVPHDMLEELLRAGVNFYEGCLIVKVVDHKSVSAQRSKATITPADEKSTPFSIHNYNQHVTPSPYLPYPRQNQTKSDKSGSSKTDRKEPDAGVAKETPEGSNIDENTTTGPELSAEKQPTPKPKVYTTVLHPTPRSVQAEITFLATTPHPTANKKQPPSQSVSKTPSLATSGAPPAKRQKMLVEPQELPELEATFTRALAPPVFLDPVDSFESAERLLHFLESPLHRARLPSPKGRKRTVAELAADEALAAEEERFMLIMDERLEPAASAAAGGSKSAVDDAAGAVPFEPRFSRFKTIENIRIQHEDKAKQEHERKVQQEHAKRQQQEQERERRRLLEQRQAEEHAKEEARRQIAVQQAQLAAQQNRMAQANGISQASQGQMSSPVVRNQTPHNTSSPIVATNMSSQAAVSMAMSGSAQGAGSPSRPPSAIQHSHPGMMGHPMAPSRSQQSHSRHGTPQMTQGTPAMSHATPVMRNVTPTQRMAHGSPPNSSMAQTPVMNHAMMGTPQMGAGMGLTPQQQQMILQQRQQQLLAQQGHQFSPQQIAAMQANAHAQQNIQSHQQQMLQHQAQQNQHPQQQQQQQQHNMQHMQNQQAYQSQLMRTQLVQMQMAQQKQQQGNAPQITPQQQHQQQMLMAAAQANGGQLPQNAQSYSVAQQYQQLFQQRLHHLRKEMAERYLAQYGPPPNYPPQIAQQYGPGLEKSAKAYVQELMRRSRENAQQRQVVAAMQQQQQRQQQQQQQQQNMMANGMGK